MSGCAVSNRFFWNRSLFYLSMPLLAAALVLAPVAEAQDTPTFDGATVSDQMYSAGVVIEALELPAASGGNGDLTYDLRPVPPGLAFDAASRTLSGTPSEIAIFLMTYEVADADGVTATLTFNILVEEEDVEPTFDGATVSDQMYSAGVVIEALELPAASGGNGDLTYDLRPVPPGLAFDAASRTLSGTPSEIAIFLMTYEVADADGDTATLTFEIEVDTMPSFEGATVPDQSYRTGDDIGVLELPSASVGEYEEPPRYSLSPEVPGLTFDAASLTLSGTPTVAGTYEMIYRVEDSDTNVEESDAEELTFIVYVELTFAAVTARQTTFTAGEEIKQPWELPVGRSTDTLTYTLIGGLPPGLVFDAEARTISGTPPADFLYAESYPFTYRAVDSDGDSAELSFTIVVNGMPSFGDQVVEDQMYTAGDEVSLGLPEASGGNVKLTYSLDGELPPGLMFDAEARTISGMPPADFLYDEKYAFTYRVTDVDGDESAPLPFTIVVDGKPSFDGKTVDVPQEPYQTDVAMSLTLPEPTGGNVIWEYRLKGELPPGLEFDDDPAKREISGMPPPEVVYAESYALTLEVWDADGDFAELPFTIVVDGKPSFGDDKTVDAKPSYPAGEEMSLTLPDADGGNVELTYSLSGNQTSELSFLKFDAATRTLSGTPSAYRLYKAEYLLTLVVKDADEDEATLDFTIVVNGKPSFSGRVANQMYTAGTGNVETLELPKAAGGNVELTYTLDGELPGELEFDAATRMLSGMLPADVTYAEGYGLTYGVSDVDGDAVTLNFTIAVNGIPSFVREAEDQQYPAGEAMSLELPAAVGGNVARTYRLDGVLPSGLTFDPATRTLSGTPPEYASYAAEGYALRYRVADVDGEEPAPLEFTLRVNGMPRFDETVSRQVTFAEGQTIDPWVLPSASGGNGQLTYALVGTLPEGLTYDAASRTLSGTLSADATYAAESEGYALEYSVQDQDGEGPAPLSFTLVVHGMPSFGAQVVADQGYEAGEAVELSLPAAAGGNGALTYALDGVLPAGLTFDADSAPPTLSGMLPADATYAEGYGLTYGVSDVDGDAVTLNFTIAVNGIPSFVREAEDQQYPAGEAMSLELPAAVGGNVARTYRLDGVLPSGLTFDPATRTLSGTPPEYASYAAEGYALRYRVADVDGEEPAPLEFTLRVNGMPRFDETVSRQVTFAEGQTIDPWVLPSASGGNGQLTYALVGTLPEGLTYDAASRTLSGTLSADATYAAESEGYALEYSVQDQDGEGPAPLSFTLVVHGMPSFGAQVVADQGYEAGEAVELSLPAAAGGNGALTYALDGVLPAGLTFDADSAPPTLSGMLPADATYAEGYGLTYGVSDVDGDAVTLNFTIAVNGIPSFVREAEDQQYPAGEAMSLELPAAVGGNVARTYRLDGVLPPGLTFDPATRTLSGTPPEYASYAAEGYALRYRVADVDGEEPAPLEFTLRVNGMPRFDETVSRQVTFAEGQTIDPWVLPSASGGNGQLTYALVGTLPEGLTYDAASRTLSGTLSADATYAAESEGYALEYSVQDQDGEGPAPLSFTLVVHGMPSFGTQVVADQGYEAGEAVELPLPAAAGGNGALTYALDGELPAGLAFDADSAPPTLSGMLPADATYAEGYGLTYGVSDVDGDAVTLNFTIAVNGIPSFVREAEDQQYPAGEAMSLELPAAVGGNVARTYRLDGVLPPGLTFDPATRTLSGTPPEYASYAAEGYALRYRVADVDGEEPAPLEFTLRVNGMPRFDETVSRQVTFAEGQTIDPWVLPSASGGNGQLTYALVGTLPEGLTYDAASRTLSGTLSADATYAAESEGYALEYSVQDQDGEGPAPLSFTLVVHGMPSFGTQVVADQGYEAGEAVELPLPAAAGGNGALTYALVGELPPGLAFDAASRTLSGTLPADYLYVAEGYGLTYGVSDVDGDAVTLNFTIAVNGIPSFVREAEDQQYTAGEAVSLELPAAVGGNVALTYFLDGDLPPGLAFNPTSRTLSGELSPNVSYSPEGYALTYRVADVDGEEPEPLTFTIAVNGMPFFEGTITNQRVPEGEEMAPLELPAALGGNGALTYFLDGDLPPGLVFDAEARTLSGTPELHVSHPAEGYELTYRVEDEDGDSAELSFFLTVDGTPTFFDATIEDRILRQNEAMDSWELPAASGGNGDLTYSLDMNVPGLNFDAASRVLSGTPTHTGVYRLVYQVEDIDGDSAELTFHITVDGAPNFSGDVANQTYIEGEAIEDLVLPLASGGNLLSLNPDDEAVFGELMYTLDNVPPGLTFDPNPMSPMLSGIPTEVGTYTLTYTAHDADDNMTAEDAAILSFEVRVEESATDRFAELNEQILSKYALAIADGTNRSIENRLEQMDRVGDVNKSFSFAAESTLHDMIQSGRIFENRPVNLSQVVNGSSFAVPFGFGRGCIVCPGSPTFWGRGDYGRMSSDDGSLDWDGNLTRAQIGLDARPGAEMLTGLALSWANGSFDYTAPLLGEERVDGTYTTRMLSLHPYVGFSPGRLGVWLTAGLGRGNLDIDDEQGTVGQQSSDASLRTASVGASGDLLASGPTQLRIKAAATVAQVEVEGGAVENGKGNRIAEQTVSANRLRLALKGSHAYEAGMDGQVTPELEVALRQDGGDGQTGAGVEVGGGLRYEGGGFTLEAMARSLVSDGDDEVEYKEWGAHLLLQRSAGTGGRGLSLRVMPTYGTQANSLTLWERSVAEIADRGAVSAQGQLRAEVGYGLAAPGGRGLYTVYSGMTQAPAQMQLRLGTRFEVDSSLSVSLESTRWQRMASTAEHGLLLRGRLVF